MNVRRRTPGNVSVKPPNLESSELENEEKVNKFRLHILTRCSYNTFIIFNGDVHFSDAYG